MQNVTAGHARIPVLGFGTFQLEGDACRDMVGHALDMGYRHVDTAQMYRNARAVGAAIAEAGVPRDEIFLTTKVWPDRYRDGDQQDSVAASLERLGLDRVDLLLLHWPSPDGVPLPETLGALNDVLERGWTRHIGIGNFTVALTREAQAASDAPLITNQVEYHPFLSQQPLLTELRRRSMALTAYAPLAQGRVPADDTLAAIAAEYGRSATQVGLRWLIQQPGVAAIPRSASPAHAEDNLGALDFALTDEHMARISALARSDGRVVDPSGLAPDWDD